MKKKGLTINIHLTNRWLYTFITIGILAVIGVGVYAYQTTGAANPVVMGHTLNEIAPPSGCTAGQVLSYDGTNWACVSQTPPTSFSNIDSYFVVKLGTKNWDPFSLGKGYFYTGGSLNFYVYKPISVTFSALGTPAIGTVTMTELGSSAPPFTVRQLSVNQFDFQQKNGGYNSTNSVMLMLLPGQYTLSVSGPNGGAWLGLNSVYGQDNNKTSTIWAQD